MDIEGHSHRLMLYVRWLFIGIGNSSCNVEKCLLLWIVFIGIGTSSCNVVVDSGENDCGWHF